MEFNPVAMAVIVVGIVAVIIGIKGTNKAVFSALTGNVDAPATSSSPMLSPTVVGPTANGSTPIGSANVFSIPPGSVNG